MGMFHVMSFIKQMLPVERLRAAPDAVGCLSAAPARIRSFGMTAHH
jgi:hypothetical protein